MSVHLDRVQSVLQRWKVIASGSCTSEHRVRLYLRDLQNEFNAEAPCTMFLADSLNHPSGKMCLLTHVSDGIPQRV